MNSAALSLSSNISTPSVFGEAFLKFQLAPQVLAVFPAKTVQEAAVIPMHRITVMPNMPDCMLGLINRRGRVFWVANLMRILGLPWPERGRQQCSLVILQVGTSPLALQVEAIEGIVTVPGDTIQPPPPNVNPAIFPYLKGGITHRDDLILILDAEAIMQSSALQHA